MNRLCISLLAIIALQAQTTGVFGQEGTTPAVSSIAFGQASLGFDQTHGVLITSTLGDEHWDVYIERLRNDGQKTVSAIRYAVAVADLRDGTRFETIEANWVPIKSIPPSRDVRIHVKVLNLDDLRCHAVQAHLPAHDLDVAIYLTGVEYDDGTRWQAIDSKGHLE